MAGAAFAWAEPSSNPQATAALDVVNVRSFGALGDGQTDDRQAVGAAAQAAAGRGGSAILYFPPGTYLIGEGSPPTLASGVVALGAGPRSIIKRGPRTTYFAILANADYANNRGGDADITVADLTFDGNGAEQSPPFNEWKHALALIGVTGATIRNCRFVNPSGDGIYLGSTIDGEPRPHPCRDICIRGNHFDGHRQGRNGVSIIDAEGVTISGNTFVGVASAAHPGGVDLEPDRPTQGVANVTILGNTFRDCREGVHAYGGNTQRNGSVAIIANVVDTTRGGGAGIGILEWAEALIVGNVVRNTQGSGITLTGATAGTIQANEVRAAGAAGVALQTCNGFLLSGNTVRGCRDEAIRLANCRLGTVSGNSASDWQQRSLGGGPAVTGSGTTEHVLLTGNVMDASEQSAAVVRTRDHCSGWRVQGNVFRARGRAVDLVGQNAVLDNG